MKKQNFIHYIVHLEFINRITLYFNCKIVHEIRKKVTTKLKF